MSAKLQPPADAAREMGISVATITRCVKRGAPVHRWGSTGYRYRIDTDEFIRWMESQGQQERGRVYSPSSTAEELAARRRAAMKAL